jgi:hypothetical protein
MGDETNTIEILVCKTVAVCLFSSVVLLHVVIPEDNIINRATPCFSHITIQYSIFNLFNSIKSITSLRDLLDIELVIMHYIRHYT